MIELITTCSSAAITAISIVIAIIQTIKKRKTKTNATENQEKREQCEAENEKLKYNIELAKVVKEIPEYISEAEEIIGTGKGVAKLQYVLNKIQLQCQMRGILFQKQGFTEEVEKILATPQRHKKTTKELLQTMPIPKVNFNEPEWYSPYKTQEAENETSKNE